MLFLRAVGYVIGLSLHCTLLLKLYFLLMTFRRGMGTLILFYWVEFALHSVSGTVLPSHDFQKCVAIRFVLFSQTK